MSLGNKTTLKDIGEKPILTCSWLAWNKLWALTNAQKIITKHDKYDSTRNFECTSFGIMHPTDRKHLLDIWVPPQKNTGASTKPDMAAHASWVAEMREQGIKPSQLNLWHH